MKKSKLLSAFFLMITLLVMIKTTSTWIIKYDSRVSLPKAHYAFVIDGNNDDSKHKTGG